MKRLNLVIVILAALPVEFSVHAQTKPLTVGISGIPWELRIDAPGFTIQNKDPMPDGRARVLANNSRLGMTLSLMLEQVPEVATLDGCRQAFRERMAENARLNPADVKMTEAGEISLLEFIFPEVDGVKLQQKNIFGCLFKDQIYGEIHLSKVQFQPADARVHWNS